MTQYNIVLGIVWGGGGWLVEETGVVKCLQICFKLKLPSQSPPKEFFLSLPHLISAYAPE